MYYLDGQLIAFTVLDILPTTISAVYCVYSPRWSRLEMGKVTALREIAMTREWNLALGRREDHRMDYKMGYYIHDCVKMRYKAAYQPSFLLDPVRNISHRNNLTSCRRRTGFIPGSIASRCWTRTRTRPSPVPASPPRLPQSSSTRRVCRSRTTR